MSVHPLRNDTYVEDAAKLARGQGARTIAYLRDLIRIVTDNPPGDCGVAADRAATELGALGLVVERHDVTNPSGSPAPTVIGWLGPRTDTPELLLNAHLDASPEGDGWTEEPYGATRRGGRIYGRGATLSKCDVAAYSYGVAAAADALGSRPNRSIAVAITADEGSGGDFGPRYVLEQLGMRPKRAICAGITPQVTIAHNGCVQLRLTIYGRASHTAVVEPARDAMRLAIALAGRVLEFDAALRRRSSSIPGITSPTVNVTRVCGGQFFGLAPGRVELWIDRRVTPDEDVATAHADLQTLIGGFEREHDVSVATEVAMLAEPLRPSPSQQSWAELVQCEATAVVGSEVPLRGIPLYTDARWFGAYDVPTVMYGGGAADLVDAGINGADENVHETDVLAAAEVVARVTARLLVDGGTAERSGG